MAEYSANAVQVVNPGESIIFTDAPVPCKRGMVKHRDDTGSFMLTGVVPNVRNIGCCVNLFAYYLVEFSANISIPTGGTPGPISLAVSIGDSVVPSSSMIVTPAAADEYFNVSRAVNVEVWRGCCENVSITNTSNQAIQVQNANIIFSRPDLVMSR